MTITSHAPPETTTNNPDPRSTAFTPPRVLIIAGSDSGGGAGIQADIKTVTALCGYAMTVVTAITAQNTQEVRSIAMMSPEIISAQCQAVLDDIGADIIKIGMLGDAPTVEVVATLLQEHAPEIPVVLDPVMQAKAGSELLDDPAAAALKEQLIPRATLVTPNIPEAEQLTGLTIETPDDMEQAARQLVADGAKSAIVKGGHLDDKRIYNVLCHGDDVHVSEAKRLDSRNTHGTGCTFASAMATLITHGYRYRDALATAQLYIEGAMTYAPGYGAGNGPMEHGWNITPPVLADAARFA